MKESGAEISRCGRYRYGLWRVWSQRKPYVLFVGLNPSTADAENDDPTLRRCVNFARSWRQYGGVYICNLFAYRATDPNELYKVPDPVGPENDKWLERLGRAAGTTVAAWGNRGQYMKRDRQAMTRLGDLHCLAVTKQGCPKHPLYLRKDLKPVPLTGTDTTPDTKKSRSEQTRSEWMKELDDLEWECGISAYSSSVDPDLSYRFMKLRDGIRFSWLARSRADIRDLGLSERPLNVLRREGIRTVSEADRFELENTNLSGTHLPESDAADMNVFLDKIEQLLPVLGQDFLKPTAKLTASAEPSGLLSCTIKNVRATGRSTENGFLVLKGSQAVLAERPSTKKYPYPSIARTQLISEGVLAQEPGNLVFTKDYEFSSPSAAASVIHGGHANGLTAWKDAKGVSLKEIEQKHMTSQP